MQIRFKNPWWVVFGSVTGLIVCNGPILNYSFGVFLKPIMADMGWDRGTASSAISFGELFTCVMVPLLGWAMDRWSIRRVALPGIAIFAFFLMLLAFTPYSTPIFILMFTLVWASSAIQTPLSCAKAIAGWFDRRRGLALGIALAGVGLGALTALRARRPTDVAVRSAAVLGYGTPVFWLAQLALLTLAVGAGLFPVQGMTNARVPATGFRHLLDVAHHLALPVLRHRIILNFEGQAEGLGTDAVIEHIVKELPEDSLAAA